MATTIKCIDTVDGYLKEIVVPSYNEFMEDTTSLRKAFYCAISLYHLHDWIYELHGSDLGLSEKTELLGLLKDLHSDFALIQGICNSAKHLSARPSSTHPGRPTSAANTTVQTTSWGEGGWGEGPYGGTARVRVKVGPNADREFKEVAENVYDMLNKFLTDKKLI